MMEVYVLLAFAFLKATQQSTFTSYSWNTYYSYWTLSGETLRCEDDLDCTLNCYASSACSMVSIIGPNNAKLSINCNSMFAISSGQRSCSSLNVYAENSTELHINVHNAWWELSHSNIYTPIPSDPQSPTTNTFITCGINGPLNPTTAESEVCSRRNNIYSVHGWETIDWTYYGNSSWSLTDYSAFPNVMHCGTDYLQSCSPFAVEGFYYTCSDTSSTCYFNQSSLTRHPTTSPTAPTTTSSPTTGSPTNAPTTPNIHFTAYDMYTWSGQTVRCLDGIDCTVNCYTNTACALATIIGPNDAALTLNCNSQFASTTWGGLACSSLNVYAENSTELHINVYNADWELSNSNIYTPIPSDRQSPTSNTFITCGINGANNPSSTQSQVCSNNNNIYSVDGWETVDWTYDGDSPWSLTETSSTSANTMHCGADYLQSCTGFDVEGLYVTCSDTSITCYPQTTQFPTAEMTASPTKEPTIFNAQFTAYNSYAWSAETVRCQDGVDCTVNCYAGSSCGYATIIGPKDAKLTLNCNSHFASSGWARGAACFYLNVYAENSTELHINVYNAQIELVDSTIYTPIPPDPRNPTMNTFITCGIIGPNNAATAQSGVCSQSNTIYSVRGWKTVEWTYYRDSSWSLTDIDDTQPNVMHCGPDYFESCTGFKVEESYYTCSETSFWCPVSAPTQTTTPSPTESSPNGMSAHATWRLSTWLSSSLVVSSFLTFCV